jgi:hypothetical protein
MTTPEFFDFILNNFHPFPRLSCVESTRDSRSYPLHHGFQLIAHLIGRFGEAICSCVSSIENGESSPRRHIFFQLRQLPVHVTD